MHRISPLAYLRDSNTDSTTTSHRFCLYFTYCTSILYCGKFNACSKTIEKPIFVPNKIEKFKKKKNTRIRMIILRKIESRNNTGWIFSHAN